LSFIAIDLLGYVRAVNIQGYLFPVPASASERADLDAMVRSGLVVPIAGTATSVRGYVAIPVDAFAGVNGLGGEA
jgi:hypothetical protein